MIIKQADFVVSNTNVERCPKPTIPEYAFIGRSNVGKSSLINSLTGRNSLAKTSGKPGKTQLINHFIINKEWYLVDLPGYGYAKKSKSDRRKWESFIRKYIQLRENLYCVFVLIDFRIPPQQNDLEFMNWLGEIGVPFVIIFTKADKVKKDVVEESLKIYEQEMLKRWEEMPQYFISSSVNKEGHNEILSFIESVNNVNKG